ncbi:MAG TPA: hypothetical protein VFM82_06210, partial [Flavobacteriaceae bacterium]|nr:hypothetical protein [Flavobacteriaceae bacterium]
FGTTVPIWTLIEFWPPSGYHTKIGDQNAYGGCMPSTFWNDPNSTFTASWQIFSTQIVVLFDD